MTPGVSYASISKDATFIVTTGTPDSDYPAQNLADTVNNTKVARITPDAGAVVININFVARAPVQALALVRHNLVGAETMQVALWSGPGQGGPILLVTGYFPVWPSGGAVDGFGQTRPYVSSQVYQAWSAQVAFAGLTGVLEIGAVEIGQWWPIAMSPGAEIGFNTRAQDQALVGGGAEAGDIGFAPRVMNGQCDFVAMATAATTGLDFQSTTGRARPFVYVQDYDDPTTWGRGCWPARNLDLPPLVGVVYRHDRVQIRLQEHVR